jgi:hypothetical protein
MNRDHIISHFARSAENSNNRGKMRDGRSEHRSIVSAIWFIVHNSLAYHDFTSGWCTMVGTTGIFG